MGGRTWKRPNIIVFTNLNMKELSISHLLGIKDLTKSDIDLIFKTADSFKEVINRPIKKAPTLRDITIANFTSAILITTA